MNTLDCETTATMYQSLSTIFELSEDDINRFLENINLKSSYSGTGDQLLLDLMKKKLNRALIFEKTCWFHLSRVTRDSNFKEGIYPLNYQIDNIWYNLYNLVQDDIKKEEWYKYRLNLENNLSDHHATLYRMKLSDRIHWGPYAMLIRASAFKSQQIGNHDYLTIPEIVEDICVCFQKIYGINLRARFIKKSTPVIVKFNSSVTKEYYLGIVLYYLYNKIHNLEISRHCNTYFNGEGNIIRSENILKIEMV